MHVLLAVALAEGRKIRFLQTDETLPAVHVGGTSIGTHHAKTLPALYFHQRFLELVGDPLLSRRYAFLTAPLRSSAEVLARIEPDHQFGPGLATLEPLLQQLSEHLATLPRP